MKLSEFDSKTRADEGVKMPLLHPVTKQETNAGLILFGADSAVHKQARKEIDARNRALGRQPTSEEVNAQVIELLARCTKGWYGIDGEDGKPAPFSQDAAAAAYTAFPELADRASQFIFNRANFFKTASGG